MNKTTKKHPMAEVGPADFGAGSSPGTSAPPDTTTHSSRIVPVLFVLGAVILIPLLLAVVALRRARRFKRQAQSSGRQQIPSLPARYRS
jgi:hypothetical protein